MPSPNAITLQLIDPQTVTILSGQSISNNLSLYGTTASGLITPAGLTGTAIIFQASVDGINFYPLYDKTGNPINIVVDTSARAYPFFPADFFPWRYIRLESNASEASDRNFTVALQAI